MSCGTCIMCCKLMAVEELSKPAGRWCQHCDKGCSIYPERPPSCREFECVYLQNAAIFPPLLRPDKSKCVLTATKEGNLTVIVDPGYPDAWKKQPVSDVILAALKGSDVVVISFGPTRRKLFVKKGKAKNSVTTQEAVFTAPDERGEQVWIGE